MLYRYFCDNEFMRCTPACRIDDMQESFMNRLETARSYSQFPFIITSAFRSVAYEKSKKRSGKSSHTKGIAVDINCRDSFRRLIIVSSLLRAGFRRIGIHRNFIHVDSDIDKPQCIWLYEDSQE